MGASIATAIVVAVIVNPAFAAAKPEAVKGFLRAVIAGTHLAIKEPERAVDEVVSRMDGGSRDLELERLQTAAQADAIMMEREDWYALWEAAQGRKIP